MNICPCCSNTLLHHFGDRREYWFCRHCWSEMPNLAINQEIKYQPSYATPLLTTHYERNPQKLVNNISVYKRRQVI